MGTKKYLPQTSIVFDKFHVRVPAGKALDEVRVQLQREGADPKGRCGVYVATLGISVRIVKRNVKASVFGTLNLAAQ